ncbi:MAG: RES domain-containing protein [Acidimicrobiales bacterium]
MTDLPPPPADLSGFPSRVLPANTAVFRLHHRDLGPFWFSSTAADADQGNRFDLPLPDGASYWALQPAVALLETLARRPVTIIPSELLDRYQLTQAHLPHDLGPVANLPVKAARRFGLTAELFTTTDRRLTRAWAKALAAAGFVAVLGLARHDVTGRNRTTTLWGKGGEHPPYGWSWTTTSIPTSQAVSALSPWGIRVVPIPFDVPTVDSPPY